MSPGVLPILPIVLATGAGEDRRRPYLVVTGLIASFSSFTLASVQIIHALGLPDATLRDAGIALVAIFGLTLAVHPLAAVYQRAMAPWGSETQIRSCGESVILVDQALPYSAATEIRRSPIIWTSGKSTTEE